MGSDSDWPVVKGACAQLKALDIPFEAHILSAHRTPAEAAEFAKNARANGFGVILCAAGMAAHLAGAFAANTTLPVIGIPMKGGAMDGLDALLATVQMPSGIPVATVALNGAKNAAWLAAEILALGDEALAAKLDAERAAMARQIAAKEEKLQKVSSLDLHILAFSLRLHQRTVYTDTRTCRYRLQKFFAQLVHVYNDLNIIYCRTVIQGYETNLFTTTAGTDPSFHVNGRTESFAFQYVYNFCSFNCFHVYIFILR